MSARKKAAATVKPATVDTKERSRQATEAVSDIAQQLWALRDLGRQMNGCLFSGWTIRQCILTLTESIRSGATPITAPADQKAATQVRTLLREGQTALDAMDEGAELLIDDYDVGVKNLTGATAIGAAIESLAVKAGTAFESAAALMGAEPTGFYFDHPRETTREAA